MPGRRGWLSAENALIQRAEEHDPYQFEVKIDYPFQTQEKKPKFHLDIFFFFPTSLGINKMTYDSSKFYLDIHDYLRFKTPRMTFRQLTSADNAQSPLNKIRGRLEALERAHEVDPEALRREPRIFAAIFRRALAEQLERVEAALRGEDLIQRRDASLQLVTALEDAREAAARFRALQPQLLSPALDPSIAQEYRRIDELLSLSLESYALERLYEPEGLSASAREALHACAADEARYRQARGCQTIARPGESNEGYVYRHALLKKLAASALFLNQKRRDASRRLEPIAFGVAAAASMAFATTVTFAAARLAPLSWSLFTVLVLSYVAKDRIKESFRSVFRRWADRHLSDHRVRVIDPHIDKPIGGFEQKFRFLAHREIPPEIHRIRALDTSNLLINAEEAEHVFRYTKITTLKPEHLTGERVDGLTDIIRVGMWRFTRRMDDPRRTILRLDEATGAVEALEAVKSYHINVILSLRAGGAGEGEARYRKLRVVLNREGIMRVEEVDLGAVGG